MYIDKGKGYYKQYIKLNIYRFLIKTLIVVGGIIVIGLVMNALILAFMEVFLNNLPNYCEMAGYVQGRF